jgi:hypothetical protein
VTFPWIKALPQVYVSAMSPVIGEAARFQTMRSDLSAA